MIKTNTVVGDYDDSILMMTKMITVWGKLQL